MDLIIPSSGLLFWMVLIFGIVFFILAKFGFPVITAMIGKRTSYINQSLEDARKAKEELEGMTQTCNKMLEQTYRQQAEILDKAQKTANEMLENAVQQARKESDMLIASAKVEIQAQKQEAINEVRNSIVDIALAASAKILRSQLEDKKLRDSMMEAVLQEVDNCNNKV